MACMRVLSSSYRSAIKREGQGSKSTIDTPLCPDHPPPSCCHSRPPHSTYHLLLLLAAVACTRPPVTTSKSTVEPCTSSTSCPALLSYTLCADLKLAELAALFAADPLAILAANAMDFAAPDATNRILPAGLALRVPVPCACSNGIRKATSVRYVSRQGDTLASIASQVYGGLTAPDWIRESSDILEAGADDALDAGATLVVPLHCACFGGADNGVPAVYLTYVVAKGDTVPAIATRYRTTATDVMSVNDLATPDVAAGDIIVLPLPACSSSFPTFTSDYGLAVANGTYAVTANRCVQCSCGPGNLDLFCVPAPLADSTCSSMQCSNSSMMLGNFTLVMTGAGCSVTSCDYGGYANGTIITTLTTTLKPLCPGQHQFPPLIPPPTSSFFQTYLGPSPAPMTSRGGNNPTGSPDTVSDAPTMDRHFSCAAGILLALCLVATMRR
ncbi:lysM domain-containing GPI-anchored protein LYP4 [Lolium perenne]|uniref:lysM domain-containing GPI-anchored protein LYP4 n=1 Tax=Lolium perenne TaxID=4522 RepID=UPI0021F53484|nr:lysM domain-containing GPI-anchored protein LYP4-like [Lolium perenne]